MSIPVIEAHDGLTDRAKRCIGIVAEVWQTLNEHVDGLCLIGGWAVYALSEASGVTGTSTLPHHRGSVDVDIALAWSELSEITAGVVAERLRNSGYVEPTAPSFRWLRQHPEDTDPFEIDLMATHPPDHEGGALVVGGYAWAPFWNGEAAIGTARQFILRAAIPSGEMVEQTVRVAGRAGLLFAKSQIPFAHDIEPAAREKHLQDVYYLVRTWPGGPEAAAVEIDRDLDAEARETLVDALDIAFEQRTSMGPLAVASGIGAVGDVEDQVLAESRLTIQRVVRRVGKASTTSEPSS